MQNNTFLTRPIRILSKDPVLVSQPSRHKRSGCKRPGHNYLCHKRSGHKHPGHKRPDHKHPFAVYACIIEVNLNNLRVNSYFTEVKLISSQGFQQIIANFLQVRTQNFPLKGCLRNKFFAHEFKRYVFLHPESLE